VDLGVSALLEATSFYDSESFALFQIMSIGAMNFAPLFCAVGALEGSPFLLI
jgi:hypothetical protein